MSSVLKQLMGLSCVVRRPGGSLETGGHMKKRRLVAGVVVLLGVFLVGSGRPMHQRRRLARSRAVDGVRGKMRGVPVEHDA